MTNSKQSLSVEKVGWGNPKFVELDPLNRRHPKVERLAYDLACERGGSTMPLCDYDLDRAEEIITGRKNIQAENARLRIRVRELEAALRARAAK